MKWSISSVIVQNRESQWDLCQWILWRSLLFSKTAILIFIYRVLAVVKVDTGGKLMQSPRCLHVSIAFSNGRLTQPLQNHPIWLDSKILILTWWNFTKSLLRSSWSLGTLRRPWMNKKHAWQMLNPRHLSLHEPFHCFVRSKVLEELTKMES